MDGGRPQKLRRQGSENPHDRSETQEGVPTGFPDLPTSLQEMIVERVLEQPGTFGIAALVSRSWNQMAQQAPCAVLVPKFREIPEKTFHEAMQQVGKVPSLRLAHKSLERLSARGLLRVPRFLRAKGLPALRVRKILTAQAGITPVLQGRLQEGNRDSCQQPPGHTGLSGSCRVPWSNNVKTLYIDSVPFPHEEESEMPMAFPNLTALFLFNLEKIPLWMHRLPAIQRLLLRGDEEFNSGGYFADEPLDVSRLTLPLSLRSLTLQSLFIESLPTCIGDLVALETLHLNSLKQLQELPSALGRLESLTALQFYCLPEVTELPEELSNLCKLAKLEVKACFKLHRILPYLGTNLQASLRVLTFTTLGAKNPAEEVGLTSVPEDLSLARELQSLTLSGEGLLTLPETLGGLTALRSLDLELENVTGLPDLSGLISLESLHLYAPNLESLPPTLASSAGSPKLKRLHLDCDSVDTLPENLGTCGSLERLEVIAPCLDESKLKCRGWGSLHALALSVFSDQFTPEAAAKLKSLRELQIECMEELVEGEFHRRALEKFLPNLTSLEILTLRCEDPRLYPRKLEGLSALKELHVGHPQLRAAGKLYFRFNPGCDDTHRVTDWAGFPPLIFRQLTSLTRLSITCLSSIRKLPDSLCALSSLKGLLLSRVSVQELPGSLGDLTSLQDLVLNDLKSLSSLPPSMSALGALIWLSICDCPNLHELPCCSQWTNLQLLKIKDCKELKIGSLSFRSLHSLRFLSCGCPQLQGDLSGLKHLKRLESFSVECEIHAEQQNKIVVPSSLADLPLLKGVSIFSREGPDPGCMVEVPLEISKLTRMESLFFPRNGVLCAPPPESFPRLHEADKSYLARSMQRTSELHSLKTHWFPSSATLLRELRELVLTSYQDTCLPPSVGDLVKLTSLKLLNCQELRSIPGGVSSLPLEMLEIQDCQRLQDMEGAEGGYKSLWYFSVHGCPLLKDAVSTITGRNRAAVYWWPSLECT